MEGLLLQMLAGVLRTADRPPESDRPPWLLRVRDALHASVREPLTIAEVARSEGVDPAHLSRTFRRYLGTTPGAYRDSRGPVEGGVPDPGRRRDDPGRGQGDGEP